MKKILILAAGTLAFAATPAAGKLAQPAHAGKKGPAAAAQGCPPGLAKKRNGCLPPGQAKKLYNVGHRFDRGFDAYTAFDAIPYDLRRRYELDPRGRYIYDDNYIYRVDPTTLIVQEVLEAIL